MFKTARDCLYPSIHMIPPLALIANPTAPSPEHPSTHRHLLPQATVTVHLLPFHLRIPITPLGSLSTTPREDSLGTGTGLCQRSLATLIYAPAGLTLLSSLSLHLHWILMGILWSSIRALDPIPSTTQRKVHPTWYRLGAYPIRLRK